MVSWDQTNSSFRTELNDGVRFLQAQMQWPTNGAEPHFCHTTCDLLDAYVSCFSLNGPGNALYDRFSRCIQATTAGLTETAPFYSFALEFLS